MRRISIVGNSGSGKSTLARALGGRLGLPVLELDSVYHQPGWTPLDRGAFQARIDAFVADHPGWVIDGNYSAVQPAVWAQADTVVWLSLGRWENMRSVVWRTLRRTATREVLWNGNRERLDNLVRLDDPERSIIRWAWSQHGAYQARYGAAMADPDLAHLRFVRITSRRGAVAWVDRP